MVTKVSPTPIELWQRLGVERHEAAIQSHRANFSRVLDGSDSRIALAVGPCSIHDPKEALEYARRLKALADQVSDKMLLGMRVYFEKPRTVAGWKGLIMQPGIYESSTLNFNHGIVVAGQLLSDITDIGLPLFTEWLDPVVAEYLSWGMTSGTIGARTTQSPLHRHMASGLDMLVGFKNGVDGSVADAINALECSMGCHSYLGINMLGELCLIDAKGNNGYVILRGGSSGPNYEKSHVMSAASVLEARGMTRSIMVDCSHGNSLKEFQRQHLAFEDCIVQIKEGGSPIRVLMLESNLRQGSQKIVEGQPLLEGVSITDGCIGWEETERLIRSAYAVL
jgi:3-deoxy-7-phosphoheptulonate synthase